MGLFTKDISTLNDLFVSRPPVTAESWNAEVAERYGDRPAAELPLVFQRILQNTMRDHFRRQKVRNLWTTQVSSLSGPDDGDDHDEHAALRPKHRLQAVAEEVDDEQQQRFDTLKERLIKRFGYNDDSAAEVLKFVASILAR